jgi:hypothetical protein
MEMIRHKAIVDNMHLKLIQISFYYRQHDPVVFFALEQFPLVIAPGYCVIISAVDQHPRATWHTPLLCYETVISLFRYNRRAARENLSKFFWCFYNLLEVNRLEEPRVSPWGASLKFDTWAGFDSFSVVMFDLAHFADQVCCSNKRFGGVSASQNEFYIFWRIIDQFEYLFYLN